MTGPLAAAPWPGSGLRITRVRTFLTAPAGVPLCVVRVETDQPGLYGIGSADALQRLLLLPTLVEQYVEPLLRGRDPHDVTDTHALLSTSTYWRGGVIDNNVVSAVDTALWDIKAKALGVPLHQLLGGRVRDGATVYGHASGHTPAEVLADARSYVDRGYRHVRCQVAIPGADTYGVANVAPEPGADARGRPWRPENYSEHVVEMFRVVREGLGPEIGLLHDVHERVAPADAVRLAAALEEFSLTFCEDIVAPEDVGWLPRIRSRSGTPLALGELFTDVRQFLPLVVQRQIDYARIRVGAVGGITPTLRLAALCELHGVRTALHGPPDVSPVGHAVNATLGVTTAAFGVLESWEFPDEVRDVFPGALTVAGGRLTPAPVPGHGVDLDERAAMRHPASDAFRYSTWALLRGPDGAVARP